jgi:D-aminopeptidase
VLTGEGQWQAGAESRPASGRARDFGIFIGRGRPGAFNAITDVAGVRVGHTTLISGDGPLLVGSGPVRTGVTVVIPHDGNVWEEPLFAGFHRLNGNGELSGLHWIAEAGLLKTVIGLTNTHSVGVVRDALVAAEIAGRTPGRLFWSMPVVGETWDGALSDVNGLHVKAEHVAQALIAASAGPVAEGNVGGGTGMVCHGFKGGIGTASRIVDEEVGGYVVGVLAQANHGDRSRLEIAGVPVGEIIDETAVPIPEAPEEGSPSSSGAGGSIIIVVATDAPLLPGQCARLAQRAGLGVARLGGLGENWSGDLFLAFSTANRGMPAADYRQPSPLTHSVSVLSNAYIDPLFAAVVEATEEAIVNALLAAETMVGRDGVTAWRLEPTSLVDVLRAVDRLDGRTAG